MINEEQVVPEQPMPDQGAPVPPMTPEQPGMAQGPMGPMPPDAMSQGMLQTPMQSQALEMDDESAEQSARKMIASSKKKMYGDQFDQFMEVLQGSENLVEDLAMISLNLLVPEVSAVDSLDMGIPYDHLMDVSAEVVSEAYDMAVQTGTYQPGSQEELQRNQNISLTMVAGELGKMFGAGGTLPEESVVGFIDAVADGNYDNISQPMAGGMV
jgi:hypothetical protein